MCAIMLIVMTKQLLRIMTMTLILRVVMLTKPMARTMPGTRHIMILMFE